MSYRIIVLLSVLAAALAACGNEPADEPHHSSSEAPTTNAASSAELWDTSLTYGNLPDPSSTGIERGLEVYNQYCAICHADGVGMAGTDSLRRSFMARGETERDPVLANRTDLNAVVIKTFVRHGVKSMPFFRKTEVSDEDLELIIEYLTRNNPQVGD